MNAATPKPSGRFETDDERWQALVDRDSTAEGQFVVSVRSTGIYCRPGCPARLPLRKNILFHETCDEAERAGFRPCKRCKPTEARLVERQAELVERACRLIEAADTVPSLDDLAQAVGLSRYHFHRIFKAQTGVTPRGYAVAQRTSRVRAELANAATVTQAIYGAGFNSSSRFYESSSQVLGMTPRRFRAGGVGATIRFAVNNCWLGFILVAASDKGVCTVVLGDDPETLTQELRNRFPNARLIDGDDDFQQLAAQVVGLLENPSLGLDLPLDIRGTAFQQRVWEALRAIPPGSTASYAEIAARIGRPKSVRAVARACATNELAIVIPCHRVVRTDGSLAGYRWGVERKRRLLQREQETS